MGTDYSRKQGDWGEKGGKDAPKVVLSLEYIDVTQGQSLRQWSNSGDLLLKLTEIGAALNKLTYSKAITDGIISEYDIDRFMVNNMPNGSEWNYPRTLVKKDVRWCKIRLGSTRRVIGFMEKNVFQVVFLDKDHEFYPTEPHNT